MNSLILIAAMFGQTSDLITPDQVLQFAVNDARTLAPEVAKYSRYISLHHVPPKKRPDVIRMLQYALNSLSRDPLLRFPVIIPNARFSLVRVQIDQYGHPARVWDDLAQKGSGILRSVAKKELAEPYFHQTFTETPKVIQETVKVPVQKKVKKQGKDRYGRSYEYEETVTEYKEETKAVIAADEKKAAIHHGPWLDANNSIELQKLTGTGFAIFRADWFLYHSLQDPAYREFIGVKELKDFKKLVRMRDEDQDLAVQGIVVRSAEVALNQRAILFTPTAIGAYWETFDYFTSIDDNDLLRDLAKKKRDAGEIIAVGPNGLLYWCLVNGQDAFVDFADPHVAIDTRTPRSSKTVWNPISCMTCHAAGMKDVADEVRPLSSQPFALLVKDKEKFKLVESRFSKDIQEPIGFTRAIYERKVMEVTQGWKPERLASELQNYFFEYENGNITLDMVEREVGVPKGQIVELLKNTKNPDVRLTQLLAGREVRRDQWNFLGYAQIASICKKVLKP